MSPHPIEESAEYATVALERAINHERRDSLECFLVEILVLELVESVESVERAWEQSLALSRLLRAVRTLQVSHLAPPSRAKVRGWVRMYCHLSRL